jgi:hypothetical protein
VVVIASNTFNGVPGDQLLPHMDHGIELRYSIVERTADGSHVLHAVTKFKQ